MNTYYVVLFTTPESPWYHYLHAPLPPGQGWVAVRTLENAYHFGSREQAEREGFMDAAAHPERLGGYDVVKVTKAE